MTDTASPLVACRICQGKFKRSLSVPEMMMGTRQIFMYSECAECGCLQINDFPSDASQYYPPQYYSYNLSVKGGFKKLRRGMRRHLILTLPRSFEWLTGFFSDKDPLFIVYRKLGILPNCTILDVGAGAGTHVLELWEAGVKGALGLDPYLPADQLCGGKLLVKKAGIGEIEGRFDLITFHHSLEHMEEQTKVLQLAKQHLNPGGKILVRIPTASSEAFEKYQEYWFQLDAPRHYFLHSDKSIRHLAAQAGLSVSSLWCDATPMQFILSEQYRMGISMHDERSFINKRYQLFSAQQLKNFERMTQACNHAMRGDQICVVMEALPPT